MLQLEHKKELTLDTYIKSTKDSVLNDLYYRIVREYVSNEKNKIKRVLVNNNKNSII